MESAEQGSKGPDHHPCCTSGADAAPFRTMEIAPKDGTVIEVMHGPQKSVVKAYWSGMTQAFVRDDDDTRKTLHRVTGWRPVK